MEMDVDVYEDVENSMDQPLENLIEMDVEQKSLETHGRGAKSSQWKIQDGFSRMKKKLKQSTLMDNWRQLPGDLMDSKEFSTKEGL